MEALDGAKPRAGWGWAWLPEENPQHALAPRWRENGAGKRITDNWWWAALHRSALPAI